jgi:ABC-type uncharacterized transport system permease subunit
MSRYFFVRWQGQRQPLTASMRLAEQTTLAAALFSHALSLGAGDESWWMHLGVGQSISLVMWLVVLIYWVTAFFHRLEGVQILLFLSAALGVLLGIVLPAAHLPHLTPSLPFALHVLVALFAYSLFTLAALLAVLMLTVERLLHQKRGMRFLQHVPPLLTLEKLLFRVLWSGFFLLSLTVLSGALFSEYIFHRPFTFNHKNVLSLCAWLTFATLLAGRVRYGWRGRYAAQWTLGGSVVLLLGYIGSKIVLEFIMQ